VNNSIGLKEYALRKGDEELGFILFFQNDFFG
jgi:hypothetical protein